MEENDRIPALYGGGDTQFRCGGDSNPWSKSARPLFDHPIGRGLTAVLARASLRNAETPHGLVAGKWRSRLHLSAPLDPNATAAEIEEGYKRALRLGEPIDLPRKQDYEPDLMTSRAWLADAFKEPHLNFKKPAMEDVDRPTEGKKSVPRRRRYSRGDMSKSTSKAGMVGARSGRRSLAQAFDLAAPTSADDSLSDNNLITTVDDNPLATPANKSPRLLDAKQPSPAHEVPFNHPTPTRNGGELSSPAATSGSGSQGAAKDSAAPWAGTWSSASMSILLEDERNPFTKAEAAAAIKWLLDSSQPTEAEPQPAGEGAKVASPEPVETQQPSPALERLVLPAIAEAADSEEDEEEFFSPRALTLEELPQADNECTVLTPASGRQRLQQLLQTTPVTPAAVRKAKRSWLPGAAAVLFKLVLTALVFGAWWLHPTCMGSQFASAAEGARSGAAMLPLVSLTYKAAVVRAAPPETPPGLWSKFVRKAEQIGISASASRPLAEAMEKRAPPAAIPKPTPPKEQPLTPAAANPTPMPPKEQPLAPAAANPTPTPPKEQPLTPPKPPTIKAEQKASLPQAAVSSKPARAPGAKEVARPPKPEALAAKTQAMPSASTAAAPPSLAAFAAANWLALLLAPTAAASLLLAYVAAARLSAGRDEAGPSTLSTPRPAAQSPSVRVTRARSASLAKANSKAPSSPSNKSASGPAASAVTASMATVGRSLRSASKAVSQATTALVSASGATSKQQRNAADEGEVDSAPATGRKGARAAREAGPTPARRSRHRLAG